MIINFKDQYILKLVKLSFNRKTKIIIIIIVLTTSLLYTFFFFHFSPEFPVIPDLPRHSLLLAMCSILPYTKRLYFQVEIQ